MKLKQNRHVLPELHVLMDEAQMEQMMLPGDVVIVMKFRWTRPGSDR